MKTIVLGVGNSILRDDGVGIHVVRTLKEEIHDPNITIEEASTGGMALLEMILGYDKAILIDAVKIENSKPGEVKRFSPENFSSVNFRNPHDVNLSTALQIADKMGADIPREIVIIGIVVNQAFFFGENLSPSIAKAVPIAVEMTLKEIQNF